jgi:hypothetical protein
VAELDIVALKVAIAHVALHGEVGERAGAVVRTQLALIEAALAERDALRTMLRRLEWQGTTLNGFRCCPWCDGQERDGHEPGCELGAVALAAREPEAPRKRVAPPVDIHYGQEVDLSHMAFEGLRDEDAGRG